MKNILLALIFFMSCGNIYANIEISASSTNLGIGTASVSNALSVRSTFAVGSSTYTSTTAPSNGALIEGNVGIGSLAPGSKLDVTGAGRFSSTLTASNLSGTNTGDSLWVIQNTTDQSLASGNVGIGTTFTTTSALNIMNGNVGIGTWKPVALFDISSTQNQDLFIINDSGPVDTTPIVVNAGGNIGIGTSNPTSKLWVGGTTNMFTVDSTGFATISSDVASSNDLLNISGAGLTTGNGLDVSSSNNSQTSPLVSFTQSGNIAASVLSVLLTGSSATGQVVRFTDSTSDTTPFAVDTSGNVGIGTLVPQAQLDIRFQTPTVPIKIGSSATDSTGLFLAMNANGNIGMGTVSPSAKLGIVGNVGIGTILYSNYVALSPPNGGIIIEGNLGIGTYLPSTLLEVGAKKLNVLSGGNVGIGSITPGSQLDIQTGTSGVRFFGTNSKWTKKSGANTACNTTCGSSLCALGEDAGTVGVLNSAIVDCADATADVCMCMGP